jgi:hypothetical protein
MATPGQQKIPDTPAELEIPLPKDGTPGSESYWADEIELAEKRKHKELPTWQQNVERYKGKNQTYPGLPQRYTFSVNGDFINCEQKRPQLCYQVPEVRVSPKRGTTAPSAFVVQSLLNYYTGPDEIDNAALMDLVLFDCICAAGISPTKVFYESISVDVQVPMQDPATGQPVIDPTTQQPSFQTVPKVIYEKYGWDHISPAKVLIPAGWLSSFYDKAPWLGWEFDLDPEQLGRMTGMPSDRLGVYPDNRTLAGPADREVMRSTAKGYELFYRASLYDPTEKNPERFRRLVIASDKSKGRKVRIHENSKDQIFDPSGKFIGGVRGNPIHIYYMRSLTDTAYPPSDSTILRSTIDEKSFHRTQTATQRRRNQPMRMADTTRIEKSQIDRMARGDYQEILLHAGPLDGLIEAVPQAGMPIENFRFNSEVDDDFARISGLGTNQQAAMGDTTRSATEIQTIDNAKENKLAKERSRLMLQMLKGYEKLLGLLQVHATPEQIEEIVGPEATQRFGAWDRSIQGQFAFTIRPDSSVRVNAAEQQEKDLRYYNLTRNDPMVNGASSLAKVVEGAGWDPATMINQQPPPPPGPEPPKITLSFKGEDLSNPAVIEILQKYGIQVSPQAVAATGTQQMIAATMQAASKDAKALAKPAGREPKHGGRVTPLEPIDQHDANLTGERAGRPSLA